MRCNGLDGEFKGGLVCSCVNPDSLLLIILWRGICFLDAYVLVSILIEIIVFKTHTHAHTLDAFFCIEFHCFVEYFQDIHLLEKLQHNLGISNFFPRLASRNLFCFNQFSTKFDFLVKVEHSMHFTFKSKESNRISLKPA